MELITDRATRSMRNNLIGTVPSGVLEFELEVMCEHEVSSFQSHMIKSWLFGQLKYKKLFILNGDMNDVYFNCILNDPEDIQINGNNGWKFTVICDSGGAWELPKTKKYMPNAVNGKIIFNNTSGSNDYYYPDIKFVLGQLETGFTIVNQSDSNRAFTFSGLSGGETISIDGETKMITSSLNLNRLSKFNKNYFRLVRGVNVLICTGQIDYVEITTQNFRRMGG